MPKKIKKFYILTFGCQMNHSDSERIRAVLDSLGYEEVACENSADLIVVNSCAVRQTSMDRIYGRLKSWEKRKIKDSGFKTLLTGCVLNIDKKKLALLFDWVLPITELGGLPELLGYSKMDVNQYFDIVPKNISEFSAQIPIMTGCDKFCAYCAVPYTRGREVSRPYNTILKEIRDLVARGYKEITLLGQNVNSYMGAPDKFIRAKDYSRLSEQIIRLRQKNKISNNNFKISGTITFPELLKKTAEIPGDFWVRFVSSHPYDMSDELVKVMAQKIKVCNQINLALQSGDNKVLEGMNRYYTVEHFKERVNLLRSMIPDISLSTDIIVGYCGESDSAFNNTVNIFKKIGFEMAYISQYSPRPGTLAEKKFNDDVPKKTKKQRDKYLNKVLEEIALNKNKTLVGTGVRVLVDKSMPGENGIFINQGRTQGLKSIRFNAGRGFKGQFVDVEITKVGAWSLLGKLIEYEG